MENSCNKESSSAKFHADLSWRHAESNPDDNDVTFVEHPQLSACSVQSRHGIREVQNDIVALHNALVRDVPPEGNAMHEFAYLVMKFEVFQWISSLRDCLLLYGRDRPSQADREGYRSVQAIEIHGIQLRRRTYARWTRWRFASNDGGALVGDHFPQRRYHATLDGETPGIAHFHPDQFVVARGRPPDQIAQSIFGTVSSQFQKNGTRGIC